MSENERPSKQRSEEEVERPLLEQTDENHDPIQMLSDGELEEVAGGNAISNAARFVRDHPLPFIGSVAIAGAVSVTVSLNVK